MFHSREISGGWWLRAVLPSDVGYLQCQRRSIVYYDSINSHLNSIQFWAYTASREVCARDRGRERNVSTALHP